MKKLSLLILATLFAWHVHAQTINVSICGNFENATIPDSVEVRLFCTAAQVFFDEMVAVDSNGNYCFDTIIPDSLNSCWWGIDVVGFSSNQPICADTSELYIVTDTVITADIDCPCVSIFATISENESVIGANDGTASVNVGSNWAPMTYLWDDPLAQTTEIATGLVGGGLYGVTITDAIGCIDSAHIFVNNSASTTCGTTTGISSGTESITGANDGQASVYVNWPGTGPYTYYWDDPLNQTTQNVSGLAGGVIYTVIVTDAFGCTDTVAVFVNTSGDLPPCTLTGTVSVTNESVPGANDGTATVVVSGGTGPYIYLWNFPVLQTTATATGLAAGSYWVQVTDAQGCVYNSPPVVIGGCTETLVYQDLTSFPYKLYTSSDANDTIYRFFGDKLDVVFLADNGGALMVADTNGLSFENWAAGLKFLFPEGDDFLCLSFYKGHYPINMAKLSINGSPFIPIQFLDTVINGVHVKDTASDPFSFGTFYDHLTFSGPLDSIIIFFDSDFHVTKLCMKECVPVTVTCEASFTYSINGNAITVTNTSTGDYNSINWNFGDGSGWISSIGNTYTYTYTQGGHHNISLAIGDVASPGIWCDSITVTCLPGGQIPTINIITPNSDGLNDDIYIACGIIEIYNRHGVLVKNLTGPISWDATDNTGALVPMGEYIILCKDYNTVTHVTVIR
ncbi:MAG: gliding motility-associated C-terminal domain-containing protein [Flavobacteriales bacterium]|nr:gliding motility-associated C-terminal domain-containing protein [Flavobacteriales bacterium]